MIVVEGPDGAGKSTLVNRLSDDLSLEIGKRGVANRDELWKSTREDTYRALAGCVHGPSQIWDRLYFSEAIYAPLMGRTPQFSNEDSRIIEHLLAFLQIPLILCLPPIETVKINVAESHQIEGVNANIRRIYTWYSDLHLQYQPATEKKVANHPLKAIKYDYTTDPYDYVLRRCKMYLEKRGTR